jgi:hypothetical protein
MLIENEDQTSLFSEEGTPINLNSREYPLFENYCMDILESHL